MNSPHLNQAHESHESDKENRLAFLRAFFRRPKEVGSVIPSSRFLKERIVDNADLANANVVVELGPGTGGTTRALLHQMRSDAKLLAIEINPHFCKLLASTFDDPRLLVHCGSATEIADALREHGLEPADVILSGIPFSTMDERIGLDILRSVRDSLSPGGRFVAYQFRDRVETLGRDVFGDARVQTELRNVPPMRVYRWELGLQGDADPLPA
jgi:phosphatidylethanolamine/phosphatidyl-N-methylethanolamine N-methyltransferase